LWGYLQFFFKEFATFINDWLWVAQSNESSNDHEKSNNEGHGDEWDSEVDLLEFNGQSTENTNDDA